MKITIQRLGLCSCKAFFGEESNVFQTGETSAEAVGKLIIRNGKSFKIAIRYLNVDGRDISEELKAIKARLDHE